MHQIFLEGSVSKDDCIKSVIDKAMVGLGGCHTIRGCNTFVSNFSVVNEYSVCQDFIRRA